MRRSLYASAGMHIGLIVWVAIGGIVRESDPVEFQVTGVSIISTSEFDAMTRPQTAPAAPVTDTPAAPEVTSPTPTPRPPEAEAPAPEVAQPAETAPPEAEATPDVADLQTPQAEVTDDIAALPSPPQGDPTAAPSATPTPQEAPRVAPTPAPVPEPEVETAPDVVEQPTTPEPSDAPVEEVTPSAPEEATTEIVTEAEEPSAGSIAPQASVRPTARPDRPASVETAAPAPAETAPPVAEEDPLAAAIADAVAEAASAPAPTGPAQPAGPPLTAGQRDGFRIAVQQCWNVGSLSSDALQTTVVVGVDMARDGRPETGSIRLIEATGGTNSGANQAFEAARRAIIRCGANGFDLPEESYDHWRSVEMVFNPEGMRLR